jgi:hypothetical protein
MEETLKAIFLNLNLCFNPDIRIWAIFPLKSPEASSHQVDDPDYAEKEMRQK